jgi:hypothetical protein
MWEKEQWARELCLAQMWKESLRGTTRERGESIATAPMEVRSAVRCCLPGIFKAHQASVGLCRQRACGLCSMSDVGVPSRTAFWKATCLGETFETTVHASVRQHADNDEPDFREATALPRGEPHKK